ncbi:unnamed protein product, partial [marine sediment metagenome]
QKHAELSYDVKIIDHQTGYAILDEKTFSYNVHMPQDNNLLKTATFGVIKGADYINNNHSRYCYYFHDQTIVQDKRKNIHHINIANILSVELRCKNIFSEGIKLTEETNLENIYIYYRHSINSDTYIPGLLTFMTGLYPLSHSVDSIVNTKDIDYFKVQIRKNVDKHNIHLLGADKMTAKNSTPVGVGSKKINIGGGGWDNWGVNKSDKITVKQGENILLWCFEVYRKISYIRGDIVVIEE